MATADFKINSTLQATRGYDATTSEAITLTLENAPAVDVFSVVYSVVSSSDGAPALTFSPSTGIPTTPTGNVTFTMPGTGFHSYLIQCQVNAGKSTNNRGALVTNADYTKQRVISIRGAVSNVRKTVPAETTQYEEDGWNPALNELAEAFENGAVGAVDTSEPILTDGAASSLSNERNIQSLASSLAFASSAAMPITVSRTDAATNTNVDVFQASLVSAGTAAAGLGPGVLFKTENGSGSQVDIGRTKFAWTDATAASEDSTFTVQVMNAGSLATAITVSRTAATVAALTGVGTRYVTADASGALGTAVGSFADETAPYLVNDTTATNTNDVPIQDLASTLAFISSAAAPMAIRRDDASTNTVLDLLSLRRTSGGTAANGIGGQVVFENEDAAGNVDTSGYISCRLTTATNGAEVSEIGLWTKTGGGSLTKNAYLTGAGVLTATALDSASLNASGGTCTIGASTATVTASGSTTTNIGTASTANNFGLAGATNIHSGDLLRINADLASTNTAPDIFELRRTTTGTAAANIGLSVLASLENAAGTVKSAGYLKCALTTATAGNETANWSLWAMGAGGAASEKWNWYYDGNFFGDYVFESNVFIADTTAGYRFKDAANRGGLDQDGSNHLRLKSYNTKDLVIYTGADASGVGGVLRATFSNTGAQTHELPVSIVYRTLWGKVFEDKTANYGNTTDASDTVIATYAAADETIFNVVATFTAWKDNTDYATYVRTATFYRDGGTLTQQGTTASTYSEASAGFATCLADLNASGTNIRGIARGVAATTINWSCKIVVTGETP